MTQTIKTRRFFGAFLKGKPRHGFQDARRATICPFACIYPWHNKHAVLGHFCKFLFFSVHRKGTRRIVLKLPHHTAQDDALWVDAYATDGCVYSIRKDAPAGGFRNGKYYHGSMTLKRGGVYLTDGNDCVPLTKTDGKYSLEDGQEYLVEGVVKGNIEGTGSIVLRIADNTTIRGCVTLKGTSAGPAYISTGQSVMIYNAPYQALQADSEYLTVFDYLSYVEIHGIVSGHIMLDCGSELTMTGDLENAYLYLAESCWFRIPNNPCYKITNSVITAAFDSFGNNNVNITSRFAVNNDYKEFYGGDVPDPGDGGDPGDPGEGEGPDDGDE